MRMRGEDKTWLEQIGDSKAELTCPTSWTAMAGGDIERFCERCQKHVINLSTLTATEAEARLWQEYRASGEVPCVTFVVEADRMVVKPEPKAPVGSRDRTRLLVLGLAASLPLAACGHSRPTGEPPLPSPSALAAAQLASANANMPTGAPPPPVETGSAGNAVAPDGSCDAHAHAGNGATPNPALSGEPQRLSGTVPAFRPPAKVSKQKR
jgi:hypothetical protein